MTRRPQRSTLFPSTPLFRSGTANSGSIAITGTNELLFGAGMTANVFTSPGNGFAQRVITVPHGDIDDSLREAVSRGSEDVSRSEEHTSELQSHLNIVCRLLL